jgi:hypothetical protein
MWAGARVFTAEGTKALVLVLILFTSRRGFSDFLLGN